MECGHVDECRHHSTPDGRDSHSTAGWPRDSNAELLHSNNACTRSSSAPEEVEKEEEE